MRFLLVDSKYVLLPNYRFIGLMKALLKEVKLAAENKNAIELHLYVYRNNKRAIKAYQKYDFSVSDYELMILRL